MARRQLPLPDNIAPARRAPPPTPTDDDDAPPPPIPSRPTPSRPGAGRPVPGIPQNKQVRNGHDDDDDYSFDSDSSTESYEDMSKGEGPPMKEPILPARGYKDSEPPRPVPPPAKNKPQVPQTPQPDIYDDGDTGEIYDEAEMAAQESEEDEEGETYDDMNVGEEPQQEEYAECDVNIPIQAPKPKEEFVQESYDEFEGIADDTYEVEEPQEEYQECEIGGAVSEEVYQIADDDTPSAPPPPTAPALPPPRSRQARDAAPPPPRGVEKKTPVKSPAGGNMPAIAMGDIQNIKDRLKKVNVAKDPPPKAEPKTYTDHNELKSKFDFFKQKEKEALAHGNKPGIAPKPSALNIKKSSSVDTVTSPVNRVEKPLPLRKTSDSLPPVPSPKEEDLPPPPPSIAEIPSMQNRELPQIPTANGTPEPPPPRGKDGYTKVNVEEHVADDSDQEIYDDALSFEDPLLKEIWYFGEIDRNVGNNKLKKLAMNGAYLLRKSSKGGSNQPYTLMVLYNNHIYNLKIRERDDGRMAIGEEKPDEMSFKSVVDLIKHHQSNDVILVHKNGKEEHTMLLRAPPK